VRAFVLIVATACLVACNDPVRQTEAGPPGDLGTMECPVVDAGCPDSCHAVRALEYDAENRCLRENLLIACSSAQGGGGGVGCYANTTTGTLVYVSGEAFAEPYFRGWRLCTEPERESLGGVPECS
jgi:hypothetical protein